MCHCEIQKSTTTLTHEFNLQGALSLAIPLQWRQFRFQSEAKRGPLNVKSSWMYPTISPGYQGFHRHSSGFYGFHWFSFQYVAWKLFLIKSRHDRKGWLKYVVCCYPRRMSSDDHWLKINWIIFDNAGAVILYPSPNCTQLWSGLSKRGISLRYRWCVWNKWMISIAMKSPQEVVAIGPKKKWTETDELDSLVTIFLFLPKTWREDSFGPTGVNIKSTGEGSFSTRH